MMRTVRTTIRWRSRLAAIAALGMVAALPLAAQNPHPIGNMVGPNSLPLADTPGSGVPNPATDTKLGLTRTGNTVTITSPWTCNPSSVKNQITLSNPDTHGRFQTVSRFSENLNKTQQVTITSFDASGEPTGFLFEEIPKTGPPPVRTGMGTLISSHNNGIYDTLELQQPGGGVLATLSLDLFSSNGSSANYISFPWGQTATLGGKPDCGGANPQVFLPVATNGHIVFDLSGTGSPDPDLFQSPLVAPAGIVAVPTLAPLGLAVLAGGLLTAAVRWLRRESGAGRPTRA